MRFIELHGSYLGEQVGSALIGMGLAMFMTKSVIVSLGVVVALLINSWMLLNNQAKGKKNPVECIKWQIVNEVKLE